MHKFEAVPFYCKFLVHSNYCGVRYTQMTPLETEALMRLASDPSNSPQSAATPVRGPCFPGGLA